MNLFSLNEIKNLNIISILLLIMPLALIAGPAVVEIIIFTSSVIFIYKTYRDNCINLYFNQFVVKLFLVFWIYLIINSFFSYDVSSSLKSSFFYIRFLFFSLSIMYALNNDRYFLKYFFIILLGCYFLLYIDSVIQFLSNDHKNIFGWMTPEPNDRVSSFFHNEMVMGSYLSRLLPILIFLICFLKINQFLILLLIFFSAITIFISGERTAIGIFFLFFCTFSYLYELKKKIKIILIPIIFVLFMSVIYLNNHYYNRYVQLPIKELLENKQINFLTPKHHSLFLTSYNIYLNNKIIGSGVNTFRHICDKKNYAYNSESCSTHPHNIVFQFLSELGIVGLLFYLFSLFLIIKKIFFTKDSILEKILIMTFLVNFFPLFPFGNFFNNWLSTIIYLPLGFYMYLNQKTVTNKN